ncbi:hypothetical protein [Paenibacillus odorifer]|uniref:hypothetical protein n=1 Tax=Paenibacillus odorifer TaxID=189426 RepID=UPI00096E3020|nr:hypothetical protein [Paenibacillus odorifer]OMD67607.1 hypothetical protein BSK50_30010 [Paenibacillus odorifer]
MKCVCGHIYELNSWEEGYEEREDFIELSLSNEIVVKSGGGMWVEPSTHDLFACPKCGTLKIIV